MGWNDQAETMFKAWTTAQKKIWENWSELANQAASAASPPSSLYTDFFEQWRAMASQGIAAWTASAGPAARQAGERLIANQEATVRFMQFLMEAWQKLAAGVEAGEAWPKLLNGYLDQLRAQWGHSPTGMAQAAQETQELWLLYLEELRKLTQPWLQSFYQAVSQPGQAAAGNGSALLDMANLYWDAYERTFGRLVESPSLGYTRELNEKMLKGFQAWQEFRQASQAYQIVLADTSIKAVGRLFQELFTLAEKAEKVQSLQQLILLWNNIADPVFIEVFSSEKYIRIQGQLLNAAMAYRIRQREIVELFLKIADMPTRTEIDEAHRNIYEQRKEVKTLKQELAEARQSIAVLREEVEALRAALASLSAPEPAHLPKASRPPAKSKKKPAGPQGDDNLQGGGHGAVSHPDSV